MQQTRKTYTRAAAAFGLIALVALAASCGGGPKRSLDLMLTPGAEYALSWRSVGEVIFTPEGGEAMTMPLDTDFSFLLRPAEVNANGDTRVAVEITKSVFPGMIAPMGTIFRGYSFSMNVSREGRVTELIDTQAIRDAIRASYPATPDEMMESISDDAIRSYIEPFLAVWPSLPVAAGDSWTQPDLYITYPVLDTFESRNYRLVSWDDTGTVVAFDSTFRPAEKYTSLKVQATGTGTGEIHLAPTTGTIRSLESEIIATSVSTDPATGAVVKGSSTVRIQAELTPR